MNFSQATTVVVAEHKWIGTIYRFEGIPCSITIHREFTFR